MSSVEQLSDIPKSQDTQEEMSKDTAENHPVPTGEKTDVEVQDNNENVNKKEEELIQQNEEFGEEIIQLNEEMEQIDTKSQDTQEEMSKDTAENHPVPTGEKTDVEVQDNNENVNKKEEELIQQNEESGEEIIQLNEEMEQIDTKLHDLDDNLNKKILELIEQNEKTNAEMAAQNEHVNNLYENVKIILDEIEKQSHLKSSNPEPCASMTEEEKTDQAIAGIFSQDSLNELSQQISNLQLAFEHVEDDGKLMKDKEAPHENIDIENLQSQMETIQSVLKEKMNDDQNESEAMSDSQLSNILGDLKKEVNFLIRRQLQSMADSNSLYTEAREAIEQLRREIKQHVKDNLEKVYKVKDFVLESKAEQFDNLTEKLNCKFNEVMDTFASRERDCKNLMSTLSSEMNTRFNTFCNSKKEQLEEKWKSMNEQAREVVSAEISSLRQKLLDKFNWPKF